MPELAVIKRRLDREKQLRGLATVVPDTLNVEARTVEVAWASEAPYPRWYGIEILDCSPDSIRLGRLMGGAALLFNHDRDELIGVVEGVRIDVDRKCRATVRFDTSECADMRFQQVRNGVLRHVSVGYMVHAMVLEKEEEGESTYRVTDWEPYEISMVTVPADPDVGVGRDVDPSADQPATLPIVTPAQPKETRAMDTTDNTLAPQPANISADALDLKRRDAIIELGVKYASFLSLQDVQRACTTGQTVAQVQELVMEKMATRHSDTRGAHLGLSNNEVGQYSIARAVRSMLTGDWKEAGLERAATEAASQRFGMGTRGLLIPMDVLAKRDFTAGTAAEAGNLMATQLRPDLFADVLRNRLALGRLGATFLFGLSSNIDIPKKTAGSSLGFVTEVAAIAETQPSTGKVSLTPKRIGGYIEFSKQAVIQSAMAVEPLLRQDIYSEYQVQFETAGMNGSGSGANPRGLRNTSGIGAVVGGTNGAQMDWTHVVGLESAVANVNAEPDAGSGYLVNTKTRGWLKTKVKGTNLPFIWDGGPQPLNGYRAEVSNIMPSNLTKGTASGVCSSAVFSANWNMLVLATFGAVEILVDETSIAVNGLNRLVMNAFIDVGVRRAADFSSMEDALTV